MRSHRIERIQGTTHCSDVGEAEDEAYRVEDVGFAGAIEAGDGVERRIPAGDLGAGGVGLEAWGWLATMTETRGGQGADRR